MDNGITKTSGRASAIRASAIIRSLVEDVIKIAMEVIVINVPVEREAAAAIIRRGEFCYFRIIIVVGFNVLEKSVPGDP